MRHAKTDYPIKATWKGIEEETDKIGYIWLDQRNDYWEVWRWSWSHSDGYHPVHAYGWGTSYRMCKEDILLNCRMKRIK